MKLFPYYSEEFGYVVTYIQRVLHRKVHLIGIRAILENGIPAWRYSEDFDIHARITKEQRDGLIESLREKFNVSNCRRTRFGFTVELEPVGIIDVYTVSIAVFDESWNERRISINGVSVYLPPLEDILVLKVMSPKKQDKKDVGTVLVK